MTARFFVAVCSLLVTGLCALSLGGRVFYLASWALILMLAYGIISVLLASRMLSFQQIVSDYKVERASRTSLSIELRNKSLLPIAPLELYLQLPDGPVTIFLDAGMLRARTASFPFFLPHVGVVPAGVEALYVSDLFHLFRLKRKGLQAPPKVVVLPRSFDVEKLAFLARDDGKALPNRASEDVTSPEDTRNYRQGDPLKRIHWKLSSRKRELIVRRFEIPAPPDTLILMDCYDPSGYAGQPDGLNRMKDTLCETALSVAKMQMEGSHPVRVPLYGARASEFKADRPGSLSLLQEELAYQMFRGGEPFDKVLNVELRRMRRTGATLVITTRLDAAVVEGVKHIRRSGPNVRFYLVTFTPDNEADAPFVQQLQRHLVEVCYVTPA
ncbi:MAG: DUF58 domain-containing protein [Clostridiales bacterium]|nr:DUF58 domain-containing protein [Clostridiales bacterium]